MDRPIYCVVKADGTASVVTLNNGRLKGEWTENMVSQCSLNLISWKISLKAFCLKCLIRYDATRWWAELSDFRRFRPSLNTDSVVKLLTHYKGWYDLNRKWSCFCRFSNLLENPLNEWCIRDISHLLWIFDENTKYEKIIWSQHGHWLISLSKASAKQSLALARAILYKVLASITYELTGNHWLSKVNPTQPLIHFEQYHAGRRFTWMLSLNKLANKWWSSEKLNH